MLENPLLRDRKSLLLYLVVWLMVMVLYFSLLYWGLRIPLLTALADSLVFNLILAGMGLGFWYPAKFISFDKERFSRFLLTHIAAGVIAVLLWLSVGFIITGIVLNTELYNNFFYSTLAWRILTGILFYFLIISFYYTIIYYSEYRDRLSKEAELRSLITEAELRSLKFQINPHFIFNSLNSISSLTVTDPVNARTMIIKLADFLRYTISNNSRQMNTLSEELNSIKLYLDIEKIRFPDKFNYLEDVENTCREIQLPNMLLQPLIENAVKHSVYDALGMILINIRCQRHNDFLQIDVTNTIEQDTAKPGTGVGLKNIFERLLLIYGRNDLMKVERNEGEFRVRLFIPLSIDNK
jgi:two-component system, LytTR family, sensor kinase